MSVSIIIPALNEASSLGRLLPALTALPNRPEVILADGGSSDQSVAIAQQAGVTLVSAPRGRARQMNAGAAIANGDTLVFLHADTVLPDGALAQLEQAMGAGAQWGRFNVRLSGRHWLFRIIERLINLRSCLTGVATGDQGIFVRRELFRQLNGFAELPLMEDVELSKRLRRIARPRCIRQPLTTSSRRWEHHGILRTVLLMWRLRLEYFLGASPDTLAQRYRRSDTKEGS